MAVIVVDIIIASIILTLNGRVNAWVSDGRYFIVACPSSPAVSPSVDCTLHIMGSQGIQVNIEGTMTGLPKTETISAALLLKVSIQGDYSQTQLLVISTSDVVSIFVENRAPAGPSMYLSIPLVDDLTVPYTGPTVETYLIAFPVTGPEQNVYAVGSGYDATQVTLTIKTTGAFIYNSVSYNTGQTLPVTLQKGEVLEILTDQDLTGTYVESTKPVGVFCGTIVQPTLEQIPPVSQWQGSTALGNFDLCNSVLVRLLVSQNSTTIQIKDDGDSSPTTSTRNKGEYYDHVNNMTTLITSPATLVAMRCTIGPGDRPFAMLLPPSTSLGLEFKCLTLAGFSNTAYLSSIVTVDTTYNVSGTEILFSRIDTYGGVSLSTMKANVPDGYLIIKALDTDPVEPFIIGFTAAGAYGYACAKGTLGSLLPDPSNSLVNVPLAVITPSPAEESSTVMIESSSEAIIVSTADLAFSSETSVSVIDPSSDALMASSSDVVMASSSDAIMPSSSNAQIESSSYPVMETSSMVIEPTLTDGVAVTTEASAVSLDIIAPSTTVQTTTSTDLVSSADTTTALSTVTATSATMHEVCFCRCGGKEILPNETKIFLEQFDIEIKRNLTLDAKTLSAYIRSKTSAEDFRPSAQNVGYFGITMICVTGSLLVCADVLNLFHVAIPKQKKS